MREPKRSLVEGWTTHEGLVLIKLVDPLSAALKKFLKDLDPVDG